MPVFCSMVHTVVNDDIDDLNDVDSSEKSGQHNHVYSMMDSNSKDNEMSECSIH